MGSMQTHAQGNCHSGHGNLRIPGKSFGDGAQQYEGRIAKHRDRDKVAGDSQTQGSMFLTRNLQDGLGHGFCRTGFFQQGPGYGPQCNDQTNIRHRATHAIGKSFQHRFHAHTGNNGKHKRSGNQCEERV